MAFAHEPSLSIVVPLLLHKLTLWPLRLSSFVASARSARQLFRKVTWRLLTIFAKNSIMKLMNYASTEES
jgi:hypothetical protein